MTDEANRVVEVLKNLRADFGRSRRTVKDALSAAGFEVDFEQKVDEPVDVLDIPTFDHQVRQPLSPMLAKRFEYAGQWIQGPYTWLTPPEMEKWMRDPEILAVHNSLREHWEDSAPMQFPDAQLGLFGVTEGVPNNLTYLVWTGQQEPEVWMYTGMDESCDKNLLEFLTSYHESDPGSI